MDWSYGFLILPGLLFFGFFLVVCLAAFYSYRNYKHPELTRYTLRWHDQRKRCQVEFPHFAYGKTSNWEGTVNLVKCEDGKDIMGATNVEVLEAPLEECF